MLFSKAPLRLRECASCPPSPHTSMLDELCFGFCEIISTKVTEQRSMGKAPSTLKFGGRGAGHRNISEMRPAIILRNYFRHQYPHRPGRGQNVRICVDPVSWPNRTPEQIESKSCVFGWARPFRRLQTEVQSGGGGAGGREHRRGTAAREGGQGSGRGRGRERQRAAGGQPEGQGCQGADLCKDCTQQLHNNLHNKYSTTYSTTYTTSCFP